MLAAGAPTFRLVHSFVWDGAPERDFLSSLGLPVSVDADGIRGKVTIGYVNLDQLDMICRRLTGDRF